MRDVPIFVAAVFTACLCWTASDASSIHPESFSTTLNVGETVTLQKTVIVQAVEPGDAKVDVFFLTDTTASMRGTIDAIKGFGEQLLNTAAGLGDVAWGVGSYDDVPAGPWGVAGVDLPWRLHQTVTDVVDDVRVGFQKLSLGFGADRPESSLIALSRAAAEAGWREGTQRFILWFGDAPGHDPSDGAPLATFAGTDGFGNPVAVGDSYPGPTLAETIAALTAENITVIGFDSGFKDFGIQLGLDANVDDNILDDPVFGPSQIANFRNETRQGTAITEATGGFLTDISSTPGASIVDMILRALDTGLFTYNSVSLVPEGNLPGVSVAVSPGYLGDFTRKEDGSFDFEVSFTALLEGSHEFRMNALVDGLTFATKTDTITVRAALSGGAGGNPPVIPLPAAGWLLLGGIGIFAALARRRRNWV